MAKRPKKPSGPPKKYAPPGYTPKQWAEEKRRSDEGARKVLEAEREAKKPKRYTFARYFKDKRGRWVEIPAGDVKARPSKGPKTNIYAGKLGEKRQLSTGRPLPKQKPPKRPPDEAAGIRIIKQHFEQATEAQWRSERSTDDPGYWSSEYVFTARPGVEYDALANALRRCVEDSRLFKVFGGRSGHVGLKTIEAGGSRRDTRDFFPTPRADFLSALSTAATSLEEWFEKYEGERQVILVWIWIR